METQILEEIAKTEPYQQEARIAFGDEIIEDSRKYPVILVDKQVFTGKKTLPQSEIYDLGKTLVQKITQRNPDQLENLDVDLKAIKNLAETDWNSLKVKAVLEEIAVTNQLCSQNEENESEMPKTITKISETINNNVNFPKTENEYEIPITIAKISVEGINNNVNFSETDFTPCCSFGSLNRATLKFFQQKLEQSKVKLSENLLQEQCDKIIRPIEDKTGTQNIEMQEQSSQNQENKSEMPNTIAKISEEGINNNVNFPKTENENEIPITIAKISEEGINNNVNFLETGFTPCCSFGSLNRATLKFFQQNIESSKMKLSENLLKEQRDKIIRSLEDKTGTQNIEMQEQSFLKNQKKCVPLQEMRPVNEALDKRVQYSLKSLLFENDKASKTTQIEMDVEASKNWCINQEFGTFEDYSKALSEPVESLLAFFGDSFTKLSEAAKSLPTLDESRLTPLSESAKPLPEAFKNNPNSFGEKRPLFVTECVNSLRKFTIDLLELKRTQMLGSNHELANFLKQCLIKLSESEANVLELEDVSATMSKDGANPSVKLYTKEELVLLMEACLNELVNEKKSKIAKADLAAEIKKQDANYVARPKKVHSKQEIAEHLRENTKVLSEAKTIAVKYKLFIDALQLDTLCLSKKKIGIDENKKKNDLRSEIETFTSALFCH